MTELSKQASTLGAVLGVVLALPVCAQEVVTEERVEMRDVALLPLADLNLSRDEIPPVLVMAKATPYASDGLTDCMAVRSAIGDLDAVLGEDFDMPNVEAGGLQVGKVARGLLGMLIPYRGVIREVSGANAHAKSFKEAIVAGMMRRAYLKGLGQAMDCPYPARPATPEVIATSILLRDPAPYATLGEQQEQTSGGEVPVEPVTATQLVTADKREQARP
ncbi:hypothetical protein [Croceibacterium mercuriale]|uniref:hypothetical protein n=1 Tax=Croceibacterium mercuriale TaxID=1572751 RepID=UPI0006919F0D|nr:hypothetical protein [Croceibacterium mercuriale]